MEFTQHKDKGNQYFRSGNYEKAVKEYQQCIDLEPNNAVGYSNLAMAHLKLNNMEEARLACTQGLTCPTDDKLKQKLQYRLNLATTAKRQKTMDELTIKEVDVLPGHLASL
ncbi:Tah1p [Nakaseomyces bracarensis]|uniref:Tah1p n=1 Tax=Nakaseomyces bracarensis TaxID=273131 RepID=UPI00387215D4